MIASNASSKVSGCGSPCSLCLAISSRRASLGEKDQERVSVRLQKHKLLGTHALMNVTLSPAPACGRLRRVAPGRRTPPWRQSRQV